MGVKSYQAEQIITSSMPTMKETQLLLKPENMSALFEERLVYDI